MNRGACAIVAAVLTACARPSHTYVLTAYRSDAALEHMQLEMVNATGRELPMPPPGLVEQAVRVLTREPDLKPSIVDAFAQAAAARLAAMGVRTGPADALPRPRLRLALTEWDVRDGNATGGVVFVSADYQLRDEHDALLWEVKQDGLPVRLTGPNLSRYEVERAAKTCIEAAMESLSAAARGHGQVQQPERHLD